MKKEVLAVCKHRPVQFLVGRGLLSLLKSTGILSNLHDRILCNQISCLISVEIVSSLNNILNPGSPYRE